MWAMIAPFSELWDRSQGSSARSSTPSTASDLQPCRDAQGSMVRGYRTRMIQSQPIEVILALVSLSQTHSER